MTEHVSDVIEKSINAIVPSDHANFRHSDDQRGESSGISINQL
jgi:hypothetical protein